MKVDDFMRLEQLSVFKSSCIMNDYYDFKSRSYMFKGEEEKCT